MTKGEKKYIGNAFRWGLFALNFITVSAMVLVGIFAPDTQTLRYSDGKFFIEHSSDKYIGWFVIPFLGAAVLAVVSVGYEIFARQRLADKIARMAVTVLLGLLGFFGFCIGGLMIVGLGDVNIPFGAEEYEAYGHTFVVCADPNGLHHWYPAIYDITDGEPVFLWEGDMEYMDTSIYEGLHIEPAEGGWLVNCTVTKDNGKTKENMSFTIDRKENAQ